MQEQTKARTTKDPGRDRPDPEVPAVAQRRRFSAKYKLKVLKELDQRKADGQEIGSVLRREGLTTSHISTWRKALQEGSLRALQPKKLGRPPAVDGELQRELHRLRAENDKLRHQLEQAELVIDVQKKLSRLLGLDTLR